MSVGGKNMKKEREKGGIYQICKKGDRKRKKGGSKRENGK
jgi:hypothetical protein